MRRSSNSANFSHLFHVVRSVAITMVASRCSISAPTRPSITTTRSPPTVHGSARPRSAAPASRSPWAATPTAGSKCFYVGSNNALYHRSQTTTGWGAESALGGSAKLVEVEPNADGRLEIFDIGNI